MSQEKAIREKVYMQADKTLNLDKKQSGFPVIIGLIVVIIAVFISLFLVQKAFAADKREVVLPEGNTLYVDKGADTVLKATYTKDEIRSLLENVSMRGDIDLSPAADSVYEWNKQTKADVAALLAIICEEGTLKSVNGTEHWNFYLQTASKSDPVYVDGVGRKLWDVKSDAKDICEALVKCMERIRNNYLEKGQDTLYKMSFSDTHNYLPYYADMTYVVSGYNSDYAWINRVSKTRDNLLTAIK